MWTAQKNRIRQWRQGNGTRDRERKKKKKRRDRQVLAVAATAYCRWKNTRSESLMEIHQRCRKASRIRQKRRKNSREGRTGINLAGLWGASGSRGYCSGCVLVKHGHSEFVWHLLCLERPAQSPLLHSLVKLLLALKSRLSSAGSKAAAAWFSTAFWSLVSRFVTIGQRGFLGRSLN